MSLHLEFEPHSWYMGFAIKQSRIKGGNVGIRFSYTAYTDNGMTGYVDSLRAATLPELKQQIREYHLGKFNGYGERIAARRLEYLRGELQAERISYDGLAELFKLHEYIKDGDNELLEAAGVPEGTR